MAEEVIEEKLDQLLVRIEQPAWKEWDFYLFLALTLLGIGVSIWGVYLSWKGFKEAREAKKAARAAGENVKIQTVTIELKDIIRDLENLDENISYPEARNLLSNISSELVRLTSSLSQKKESSLQESISKLRQDLDLARESLNTVQPELDQERIDGSVYRAIEKEFYSIRNCVSELMGLLEEKSVNFGANGK